MGFTSFSSLVKDFFFFFFTLYVKKTTNLFVYWENPWRANLFTVLSDLYLNTYEFCLNFLTSLVKKYVHMYLCKQTENVCRFTARFFLQWTYYLPAQSRVRQKPLYQFSSNIKTKFKIGRCFRTIP